MLPSWHLNLTFEFSKVIACLYKMHREKLDVVCRKREAFTNRSLQLGLNLQAKVTLDKGSGVSLRANVRETLGSFDISVEGGDGLMNDSGS